MLFILLAAALAALDLAIKRYIDGHKEENCHEPVLGGHVIITRFYNTGAMLGFLRERSKLLLGFSICLMGSLIYALGKAVGSENSGLLKTGLALLVGGAASNVYDRITRGKVTDYFRISIGSKKLEKVIFNIGDFAIFLGGLLMVFEEVRH